MQLRSLALAALLATGFAAHADTVALWDYNTTPTTTKHTVSANGTTFSTLNGVTTTFATGSAYLGAAAGQALNTAGYAAQGTGNLTRGVQFTVDTSGYTDLVLTFSQRNSNTASAWTTLQYTVDGENWLTATTFKMASPSNPNNPSFADGLTYDFTSIAAANDNTHFGFRFMASFAPGTSAYAATLTTGAYAAGGTIRYDNILLSGTPIPDEPVPPLPVPEPQTYALMLAGLATVGLLARRRRAG